MIGGPRMMTKDFDPHPGRTFNEEFAEAQARQAEGNTGRARTCARRAAGMVLRERVGIGAAASSYAPTFILALRRLAGDFAFPAEVRAAAARLVARSKPDRTSASENPAEDAEIILRHFRVWKS